MRPDIRVHPCALVLIAVIVSGALRFAAQGNRIDFELSLIADILFVVAVVAAIVMIVQRRKARRGPVVYCHQCGKPYRSEKEMEEHALTHQNGG